MWPGVCPGKRQAGDAGDDLAVAAERDETVAVGGRGRARPGEERLEVRPGPCDGDRLVGPEGEVGLADVDGRVRERRRPAASSPPRWSGCMCVSSTASTVLGRHAERRERGRHPPGGGAEEVGGAGVDEQRPVAAADQMRRDRRPGCGSGGIEEGGLQSRFELFRR